MITEIIIQVVVSLVSLLFVFLPVVSLSTIPLVGEPISSALLYAVTTWNAFLITFPYAVTAWNMLLLVIIPFEILLMIGKFFLGHRLPANNTN